MDQTSLVIKNLLHVFSIIYCDLSFGGKTFQKRSAQESGLTNISMKVKDKLTIEQVHWI